MKTKIGNHGNRAKRIKELSKCSVKNEIHDDTVVIPDEFKGEDYTEEPAKGTKTKKNGKTCPKIKPVSAEDRYPKRNLAVVKYRDPKALKDDDFLYCDDCEKLYLGDCSLHGPYVNVKDTEIKMGLADRAKKTCPEGITVGPSGIRKGGLGAWCAVDFKKNTVFGPYEGEAVHRNDVTKLKPLFEGGYAWEIYKNGKLSHYIDGGNVKISNWLRYINCACFEEQQNLISYQYRGKIYYRLYKAVKRGSELLVWYGEQYAQSLGIPTDYKVPLASPVPLKTERKPFLDEYFECEKCGKVFADEEALLRHRKSKHPVRLSTNKHKCQWCEYSSDNVHNLEYHKRTHTGEQPFKCDVCWKRFARSSHLKRHNRIHTNERPYQCERCNKRFNVLSSLNRHIRTLHDKIASFVCRECGAKFGHSNTLQNHVRTHSGEKPYKCRECGADFARSTSLRNHIISLHTKEFPHRCSTCGKGFLRPSELAKHKNKVH